MSVTDTVNQITAETFVYAPQALATIGAVEKAAGSLPGATKKQIVVNSIIAGARVGEASTVPQVQAISSLVDMIVSILNLTGLFGRKSTPAATPTPAA